MLLLVLRGTALLPLRGAPERGAPARGGTLLACRGAHGHVLGALPGAGRRRRAAAPRAPPSLSRHYYRHVDSDLLDTNRTSSECARFEVIVLR